MTTEGSLLGRTVLVTRGAAKGDRLGAILEDSGAAVVRVPLIAVEQLEAATALAPAMARLDAGLRPAWVVLTSQVAAEMLLTAVDGRWPRALSVAAVGPATAAALAARGVNADLVSGGQTAESLGRELARRGVGGAAVLVVAAAGGRDDVAPALGAAGAIVERLEVYRSVLPAGAAGQLRAALSQTHVDAVTFTSGSTVRNFSAALRGEPLPACPAVCIGPVTAEAAEQAGWAAVVTAVEHTAAGVAEATVQALGAQRLP